MPKDNDLQYENNTIPDAIEKLLWPKGPVTPPAGWGEAEGGGNDPVPSEDLNHSERYHQKAQVKISPNKQKLNQLNKAQS